MDDVEVGGGAEVSGADAMAADLDALDSDTGGEESLEASGEGNVETPDEVAGDTDEVDPGAEDEVEEEQQPELETPDPLDDKPPVAKEGEELPEGVSVKERNGKKIYELKETRYHKFHSAFVAARDIEQVFGEALTKDAAQLRQDAYIGQEMMIADFMSGDPKSETRFLGQLAAWSRQAQEIGEVRHNPIQNIAKVLPDFLIKSGDKQTFEALATPVLRAKIDELQVLANKENNHALFVSLQHLERHLFKQYKTKEQIANPDPIASREASIAAREKAFEDRENDRARSEFVAWNADTGEKIRTATAAALEEAMGPEVVKSYEKFPADFRAAKALLKDELKAHLAQDKQWQLYLQTANRRAQNASSPTTRAEVQQELAQRYAAKAKWWAANSDTMKDVLNSRASAMKATSTANHKRLQSGASRREPGSVGTPAPQRISDSPNGKFGKEAWEEAVDAAIG